MPANSVQEIRAPNHRQWIVQKGKVGKELFFPSEFLPCWDPLFVEADQEFDKRCPFIGDKLKQGLVVKQFDDENFRQRLYKIYQTELNSDRSELEIRTLCHFTDNKHRQKIVDNGLLKAFKKHFHQKVNPQFYQYQPRFVWLTNTAFDEENVFGVKAGVWNGKQATETSLKKVDTSLGGYKFNPGSYASSPSFGKDIYRGYGMDGFEFDFNALLASYASSFQIKPSELVWRNLGTFAYPQEVTYAILIFPSEARLNPQEIQVFGQFPQVNQQNATKSDVINFHDGKWWWKPYSTSSQFEKAGAGSDEAQCRWDHITFGFYFPTGNRAEGFDLHKVEYKKLIVESSKVETYKVKYLPF